MYFYEYMLKHIKTDAADIDVADNYYGDLICAYCGTKLTKEGIKKYYEALHFEVACITDAVITIRIHSEVEYRKLRRLLYDMAGYCSVKEYEKCFKD